MLLNIELQQQAMTHPQMWLLLNIESYVMYINYLFLKSSILSLIVLRITLAMSVNLKTVPPVDCTGTSFPLTLEEPNKFLECHFTCSNINHAYS